MVSYASVACQFAAKAANLRVGRSKAVIRSHVNNKRLQLEAIRSLKLPPTLVLHLANTAAIP